MVSRIQFRRGMAANLRSNPLLEGEPAFTLDTKKLYIASGSINKLINVIEFKSALDVANYYTQFKTDNYGLVTEQTRTSAVDIYMTDYKKASAVDNISPTDRLLKATEKLDKVFDIKCPIDSPEIEGDARVITHANMNNTTYIASTEHTINAIYIHKSIPIGWASEITGTPTAPSPRPSDVSKRIATTEYVVEAVDALNLDGSTF